MKITTVPIAIALLLPGTMSMAQTRDLESRIEELEAAVDLLQDRIERLEEQQAPRRISEEEAEAILRKKKVSEACTEELGPAPDFAPVLGTKVNTEYIAYLKRHRACMRDRGVDY
jgi:outer membrane murein-binding lipoprotein Lpp